jgi:hypothetical protein
MLLQTRARRDRHARRGQSLVEFALIVPVLLLILLLAIDFGRAFYSWIVLQNAARIGANFAGVNADAWEATPDIQATIDEYNALVQGDVDRAACDPSWGTGDPPAPLFTDSAADTSSAGQTPDTAYDVGDRAKVGLVCVFHPLTPIISAIVGANVTLSADSQFRIRAGDIAGLTNAAAIPPPSNSTPTPTPTSTATSTATATAGACTVTIVRSPGGNNINSGETVSFNATASGCTITSYAWTFPLGTPGNSVAPSQNVIFSTPNNTNVTVTLVAQTSSGQRTANDSFNLKK